MIEPFFQDNLVSIYHGDSREILPALAITADMVWTDPPYAVGYVGKTKDALTIEGDAKDLVELEALLRTTFDAVIPLTRPGAIWFVAAPAGPATLPFAKVLTDNGVWRQTLVWVKSALVMGHSDYHYRHEILYYGWTPGAAHQAPPTRDQDSVWLVPKPSVSGLHPTMKPVGLVERAILNHTELGDLILDPFMGSGTTLLAARTVGRKAIGIEIKEQYCEAAVKRLSQGSFDLFGNSDEE